IASRVDAHSIFEKLREPRCHVGRCAVAARRRSPEPTFCIPPIGCNLEPGRGRDVDNAVVERFRALLECALYQEPGRNLPISAMPIEPGVANGFDFGTEQTRRFSAPEE